MNSENNEKSLCFLHEIEGEILFSTMTKGYALIFYIRDNNRFHYMDSPLYQENISYVLRYYSLMDLNACSKDNSTETTEYYDLQEDVIINPIIIKPELFQEIIVSNSSMISLLEVDENLVVYSKLYDTAIFRSLIRKSDQWEQDLAIRFSGDLYKRNSQQTIGLKILHKNYRSHKQVLAVYVRYCRLNHKFNCGF